MNANKIPNKRKEPYTYARWKKLGLFEMTEPERILMIELNSVFTFQDWIYQGQFSDWGRKDMAKFVKFVVPKIIKSVVVKGALV